MQIKQEGRYFYAGEYKNDFFHTAGIGLTEEAAVRSAENSLKASVGGAQQDTQKCDDCMGAGWVWQGEYDNQVRVKCICRSE